MGEHGLPGCGTPLSYLGGGRGRWGPRAFLLQVDFPHFLDAREGTWLVSFGILGKKQGQRKDIQRLFWLRAVDREGTLGPILPLSLKPSKEQISDLNIHASSGGPLSEVRRSEVLLFRRSRAQGASMMDLLVRRASGKCSEALPGVFWKARGSWTLSAGVLESLRNTLLWRM